jgi:NADPH-dependent 2,4-dienoyl-CoA reductase/sulfur reductase-like enzyme
LVVRSSHILRRSAHNESAVLLQNYFSKQGVDIRLECSLKGLDSYGRGVTCQFPDSIVEEGDFVAVCTGVEPSVEFLEPGQVGMDEAILVDEKMQTSMHTLYAAGDVCQGMNFVTGKRELLGLWGNACHQGRIAGLNMAGVVDAVHHGAIPQHVSPFFNWKYAQLGDVHRNGENVRILSGGDPEKEGFYLFVFDAGVLVGVNLINRLQGAGRLKSAILRKVDFGELMRADSSPTYDEIIEKINFAFI